jgi:DNA-binding HxlR family transcriptional regulator
MSCKQYPTLPPRVDYTLTGGGVEVARRVDDLIAWLQDHVKDLVESQRAHDRIASAREAEPLTAV